MKRSYEVADAKDRRAIGEFLKREGQFLLPMVELVERAELAIDEVIEVVGRATIEAVSPTDPIVVTGLLTDAGAPPVVRSKSREAAAPKGYVS